MDAIAAVDLFFSGKEKEWSLCDALRNALAKRWPDTQARLMKTCISFDDPKPYCYVSYPRRRCDEGAIVVSFLMRRVISSERVDAVAKISVGRYTHHMLVRKIQDVDSRLIRWLNEGRNAAA